MSRNIQNLKYNRNTTKRLIEGCGKVLSEKNAYKSVKTALLLSKVIDADHQNSCLFTNKGHFSSPLCVLIGVLANTLPIALTRYPNRDEFTSEHFDNFLS